MTSGGRSNPSTETDSPGTVLVGCPVFERDWILGRWFDHLETWPLELGFVFAYTPGSDRTLGIIQSHAPDAHIILVEDGDHSVERNWGIRSRLETLADMRNSILRTVRALGPDFYFSLDSDVLVAPWEESSALFNSVRRGGEYDAIAPLTYLGPGDVANAFHWRGDHITRLDKAKRYGVPQPVGVLCASILMNPIAYNAGSYSYDMLGEDIAWARSVRQGPVRLGFNSSVIYHHVMSQEELRVKDERVPWSS